MTGPQSGNRKWGGLSGRKLQVPLDRLKARHPAQRIHERVRFQLQNVGSNDVSMYTINATTGVLTSIGVMATGTNPVSIAVDPTGKFAYVANSGSNNLSMYSINGATGALTPLGTIGT
jgi:6-phosphogluconolactonase (cycloisomerase 2 family)